MTRAIAPVVSVTLLVGVTVVLAAAVAAALVGLPLPAPAEPVVLSVSATADDGRIVVTHEGGRPIDVRDVTVRIRVDGTPLAHQPPVPFFSATGFLPGPTGAFNTASDPVFEVSDRASLRVAGTNSPPLEAGARLTVGFYRGDRPIAVVETRVR